MRKFWLSAAVVAICSLFYAGSASAQTTLVDPPIFIGSPTCAAPPGCPVFGSEVNGITGNTVVLDLEGGSTKNGLGNPVLLIIGVVNNSLGGTNAGFVAPTITPSAGTASGATFNGLMTSGGDAYAVVHFTDPNGAGQNSESFVNWSAADSSVLGITASNFGIYSYQLTNPGLSQKGATVSVTFNGPLPAGTFVIAIGCDAVSGCNNAGNTYATPFTQSGLIGGTPGPSPVPEPSAGTLGVVGAALLFAGIFVRRRFAQVELS